MTKAKKSIEQEEKKEKKSKPSEVIKDEAYFEKLEKTSK